MTEDAPIACSLGASGLQQRLAAMAEIGADSLISRSVEGNRRLLRFRASSKARRGLEGIVKAEAECCPFLGLSLSEEGSELILSVTAPEDAQLLADELVKAFSGAAA